MYTNLSLGRINKMYKLERHQMKGNLKKFRFNCSFYPFPGILLFFRENYLTKLHETCRI